MSLKAKRKAAVRTDWVTLGAMPDVFVISIHRSIKVIKRLTSVETGNTFFPHNALETGGHALSTLACRHVSTGLNRDVWVRDARGGQLAESSEQEAVGCGHLATLLEHLLELLENGVLQDRVDDQDERGQHAGEQTSGTVLADDLEEGRHSVRLALLLHFHVAVL